MLTRKEELKIGRWHSDSPWCWGCDRILLVWKQGTHLPFLQYYVLPSLYHGIAQFSDRSLRSHITTFVHCGRFPVKPRDREGPRPPTAGLTWPIISRAQLAATETKAKDRKRAIASSTSHIRPTAVAVKASTNMQHTRHTIDQKWASAFQLDFWIFASRHSKPCLMSGNLGPYGAPCTESKAVVHDFGVVQGPKNCKAHYCLWVVIWCHLPSKNKVTRNNDDPREV